MIEAMARALPCIGSDVGGIPELLEPEYIVPPNDPDRLAEMIVRLAQNPARMVSASARNLKLAHEYSEEILAQRRLAFYSHVRDVTAAWMSAGKRMARTREPIASVQEQSSSGGSR
jgi:glycosyltransferase involved in cell wall biosynthesis